MLLQTGEMNFIDSVAEIPDTFNMMLDYPENHRYERVIPRQNEIDKASDQRTQSNSEFTWKDLL